MNVNWMSIFVLLSRKVRKMKNAARKSHKSPYALMLLCSCALMLLCTPVAVHAVELPETAKLVPPETVMLVDIGNFSQLKAQFEKTSIYRLYKDPAMKAFVDDIKAKWQKTLTEEAGDDGFGKIIADAVTMLPQGRAAVALVLDERIEDTNEPPVVFITQWGENAGKVRETVAKIVSKAVDEKDARRQTEDYRGVGITIVTAKPSDALSYCFIDDCLILSGNTDTLKFVIAQIKGADSPTLADDDDYAATLRAVGPSAEGQIDIYVNIKQLAKMAVAKDTTGNAKTIMTNLGFDNVISLGCSINVAGGQGGTSSGKALLKIDGAKKGIPKMLEVETAPLRMPQFISASAYVVSFTNLNVKKAFTELSNILTSFSPQFPAMLYMPLSPPGPQGEPPLQLKSGIIDHLGSQIVFAQSINKAPGGAESQNFAQPQPLFALAIENRSALEKSLLLIHSGMIAPNNPDARRELLGHTIYSLDLSGIMPMLGGAGAGRPMQAPMPGGAPGISKTAFTVTDTHLIFATEAAVEQAIRTLSSTGSESLDSVKWFARAKSNIPSVVGLAGLKDMAASIEQLWSVLRELKKAEKNKDPNAQINVGTGLGSGLPQMILSQADADMPDFSLLPEFDIVRKYFGLAASYGISRQDGFFFEFKHLNPDTSE
ncbi:MAG: hypothetical protein CEE38_01765 [Planctomycetes bacterium B3_Pla]|nr:MAG: hypothetical protein CEE38_01765 [Planctomycetes bacterium B3_Pla]